MISPFYTIVEYISPSEMLFDDVCNSPEGGAYIV